MTSNTEKSLALFDIGVEPELTPARFRRSWWNVDECAEAIGRTSRAVYCLVNRKAIPFHKENGRLVFYPNEIRAWLTPNTGATNV